MRICSSCGANADNSQKFCRACGAPLPPAEGDFPAQGQQNAPFTPPAEEPPVRQPQYYAGQQGGQPMQQPQYYAGQQSGQPMQQPQYYAGRQGGQPAPVAAPAGEPVKAKKKNKAVIIVVAVCAVALAAAVGLGIMGMFGEGPLAEVLSSASGKKTEEENKKTANGDKKTEDGDKKTEDGQKSGREPSGGDNIILEPETEGPGVALPYDPDNGTDEETEATRSAAGEDPDDPDVDDTDVYEREEQNGGKDISAEPDTDSVYTFTYRGVTYTPENLPDTMTASNGWVELTADDEYYQETLYGFNDSIPGGEVGTVLKVCGDLRVRLRYYNYSNSAMPVRDCNPCYMALYHNDCHEEVDLPLPDGLQFYGRVTGDSSQVEIDPAYGEPLEEEPHFGTIISGARYSFGDASSVNILKHLGKLSHVEISLPAD